MTIDLPRTALLGVGSMSGAVLDGLLAAGLDPATVTLTTKSEQSAAALRDRALTATASDTDPDANRAAVRGAALVVLGVKPYVIADLLDEVAGDLEPGAVLVSVAVGTTTASMEARLPEGVRVVRALPNTPIGVGHGVTGISAGASADAEAVALASSVFTASGEVIEVPESQLDALSAVSGSGPRTSSCSSSSGSAPPRNSASRPTRRRRWCRAPCAARSSCWSGPAVRPPTSAVQ